VTFTTMLPHASRFPYPTTTRHTWPVSLPPPHLTRP